MPFTMQRQSYEPNLKDRPAVTKPVRHKHKPDIIFKEGFAKLLFLKINVDVSQLFYFLKPTLKIIAFIYSASCLVIFQI